MWVCWAECWRSANNRFSILYREGIRFSGLVSFCSRPGFEHAADQAEEEHIQRLAIVKRERTLICEGEKLLGRD